MSFLLSLAAASAASQIVQAVANPLSNAESGLLQCHRPDIQKKTCQSIASYSFTGTAAYDNTAVVPIAENVTLETNTPVVVKEDAVCGFIRAEDTIAGVLRVNNVEVEPDKARPVLANIAKAMGQFAGKEICTRYEDTAGQLTAKVSINGTYQPGLDQRVIWVLPSEGYVVTR